MRCTIRWDLRRNYNNNGFSDLCGSGLLDEVKAHLDLVVDLALPLLAADRKISAGDLEGAIEHHRLAGLGDGHRYGQGLRFALHRHRAGGIEMAGRARLDRGRDEACLGIRAAVEPLLLAYL